MRALVTGAAGFLGSHLCDRLVADGHCVIGLDNLITGAEANLKQFDRDPSFTLMRHDVTKLFEVEGTIDAIFHFASPTSPADYLTLPIETLKAGSSGTYIALELAEARGARFFLASTSEAYGDPQVHPQPETYWGHVNPVGPRGVYDEAKRFAEAMTMAYHRHNDVDTRIARIFNTYGPRMRPDDGRVVSNFIVQALAGEPVTIYGDGSQTRSFCYVDDQIEGLMRLFHHGSPGPTNIGNPAEVTVSELAQLVIELTGSGSEMVFRELPVEDPQVRCPDISKAKTELGWEPGVSLKDGLLRTIEYFKTSIEH